MKLNINITIFLLALAVSLKGQFIEKHNLAYLNGFYDVFIIKVDSALINNFSIEENKNLQPESDFMDSIERAGNPNFFAITAGVVDKDCNPIGLFLKNGNQTQKINLNQGVGNFFIKPNGFFAVNKASKTIIVDATTFQDHNDYMFAIQSGPMLVIGDVINKAFDKNSKNRNFRCGVGQFKDGTADYLIFIKSLVRVSFYQLAQMFKEKYNCSDALNLESGNNCSMHLPTITYSSKSSLKLCRYLMMKL